jgi:hypothetical protein
VKNSKYAFRYSNILDVPQVRTTRYGKKSFMFAAATLWNDLKGQKLKLLRKKVWNIVNLLNLSKYRPKRLSIFSCCDAFLQIEKALVSSLQIRRIRTMALETYKIVNKLAPVFLHDLVNVKNSKYAFRYSNTNINIIT